MDRRPILIAAAGLLLLVCLCLVLAGGGLLAYRGLADESRALTPLATLCSDGGGAAEAPVYRPGPGVHPAAFFQADASGDYGPAAAGFNVNWLAAAPQEAELVVCIDSVTETVVEVCAYDLGEGATGTVERVAVEARFRVLAAHTGQELLRNSGISLPRDCAEQETFSGDQLTVRLSGHPVAAVSPGVAPLVAPDQ